MDSLLRNPSPLVHLEKRLKKEHLRHTFCVMLGFALFFEQIFVEPYALAIFSFEQLLRFLRDNVPYFVGKLKELKEIIYRVSTLYQLPYWWYS